MAINTYLIIEKTNQTVPIHGQLTIGRGLPDESDKIHSLKFPEPEISRIHAIVKRNEFKGGWILVNKSKRGTMLNGVPIGEESVLRHGDLIEIGPHSMIFCDDFEDTMEHPVSSPPSDGEEEEEQALWFEFICGLVFILIIMICLFLFGKWGGSR